MDDPMVVYDGENGELRTVSGYFAARPLAVLLIRCLRGPLGQEVCEEQPLADVYWSDGSREAVAA